jgi:ribosomal protein S18 acetylase RimI-like enzyme
VQLAYSGHHWSSVCQIYDLAKQDELGGIVPRDAILPLADDPVMLSLFNRSEIFIYEVKDEILGFGGITEGKITWLFVHPHHRRKCVATALLETLIARLSGNTSLNVAKANVAAVSLYSKCGFFVEREFLGTFNGFPCEVLQMRLESVRL